VARKLIWRAICRDLEDKPFEWFHHTHVVDITLEALQLWIRMYRVTPPFPQYIFMSWYFTFTIEDKVYKQLSE
jgi:hypothetical protein